MIISSSSFFFNFQQVNGTYSTSNSKGPTATVPPRPFNSFLTPIRTTGPSLQQLIPCLTTTTTLTNKTSMIKKTTTITPHPPPPGSHDVVDLTEEEDNDNANKLLTQKISPIKSVSILFS